MRQPVDGGDGAEILSGSIEPVEPRLPSEDSAAEGKDTVQRSSKGTRPARVPHAEFGDRKGFTQSVQPVGIKGLGHERAFALENQMPRASFRSRREDRAAGGGGQAAGVFGELRIERAEVDSDPFALDPALVQEGADPERRDRSLPRR